MPDMPVFQVPSEQRQAAIACCLRQLEAYDPQTRAEAARQLGELRAEPQALLAALSDRNGFVRAAAAGALGSTPCGPSPEVVDGLLAAIDDSNDYVCAAALRSLGALRAESARQEIACCLEDAHPRVVQAAILALARLGPPSLAERLATFLDARDAYVRAAAAQATATLAYRPAAPRVLLSLQDLLAHRRPGDLKLIRPHIEALAALDAQEAVPLLVRLAEQEIGLRSMAVRALAYLAPAASAELLAPLLADPSSQLRESLIGLMRAANYGPALPAVRLLLNDPKTPVKLAALGLLAEWGDTQAAPQVRALCYHESNPYVRPAAVGALAALLGQAALPDLVRLAGDQNTHVRVAVATALGGLSPLPASGQAALAHLASDSLPVVADAAAAAITALGLDPGALPAAQTFGDATGSCGPGLLPEVVLPDAPALLRGLESWQAALPTLANRGSADELAAIDEALAQLLVVLRKASEA